MQGLQKLKSHADLKSASVWFKTKLISQFLSFSFLLTQPFFLSYLHAAPVGGNIVGGTGSISHSEFTTTINQSSQNLAVNWQSFDINTNEKVNFIQPNSSSIALNRILGNNGSTIQGQINANGQVILVNPNGIIFTPTATINVGGLVASSLDMTPDDFMNGNYIFNEVLGAEGIVVNSGIINASTGGNVALIGKQVKNEGLISANLGSVVLAAGKQSVLTFDNHGLLGVKVTKEVLQEEIGIEEAIINSGDIKASGGRVLLTASTSQDVFSEAVNTGVLDQATSVVVNDDGTFTLGAGADVLNSGSIDVSTDVDADNTARIVLLGENITSSGTIKADVIDGQAGEIELHATDKTLLTEYSITSAQAFSSGQGGLIKVLGDKVGLFDSAQVYASGANGGGEVLIGGDRQGLNSDIRNARFTYLGENASVNADATLNGDGGKIITFAKDTARIHASLFARGGVNGGNGGFIETSGLKGFEISKAPDVSAINGNGGLWLIDPNNIRIINDTAATDTEQTSNITTTSPFETSNDGAILEVGLIETALSGGDVLIETTSSGTDNEFGNITFEANLDFNSAGNSNRLLTLKAQNDITFTSASSITDSDRSNSSTDPSLNLDIEADSDNNGAGNVNISTNSTGINLFGGTLDIVNAQNVNFNTGLINTFDSTATSGGGDIIVSQAAAVTFNGATINTDGGDIDIQNSSSVAFNGGTLSTNGGFFKLSTTGNVTSANPATNTIATSGGNFIVDDAVNFDSTNININVGNGYINLDGTGSGATGNVILGDMTASSALSSDLFITKAASISQAANTTITIARNTDLNVTSGTGSHSISLEENTNNFNRIKFQGANVSIVDANRIYVTGGSSVTSLLKINAAGDITGNGDFAVSNASNDAVAIFNTTVNATTFGDVLLSNNNNFNNVKIVNANNVELKDVSGSIAIEANDGINNGGIRGNLIVSTSDTNAGDIADMSGVLIPYGGGSLYTGEINVGGNATFNVATGRSITLDNGNNSFDSAVNFNVYNHGSPEINNVTFTDSTELTLGDIYVSGNLNVTGERIKFAHLGVLGNLTATTTGTPTTTNVLAGSITQTTGEHLYVASLATFNATGDITLTDSANDFNNVTILNGKNVSLRDTDSMSLLGSNTTGNLSLRTGGDLYLVGNIATNTGTVAAGNVEITGNVLLATPTDGDSITINTNHATLTDGSVTFNDFVDNDAVTASPTPRNKLNIISGDGDVSFLKGIGTDYAYIGGLTINSGLTSTATVDLKAVNTRHFVADSTDAIDITAGTINLGGNLVTNTNGDHARGINLNGNVVLSGADIVMLTNGTVSDGRVAITGTVNSDATNRSLTIETDTGTVDLQQAVGGASALSSLSINSGAGNGIVNLAEVNTTGGSNVIRVDGTTITLNGDVSSNTNGQGGDIRFDGDLVLNNSVTIDSAGTGSAGQVDVNGNINGNSVTNSNSLTIYSGDNAVNLNNVGNTEEIQKLTITNSSGDITVGSINTRDNTLTNNDSGVEITTSGNINLTGDITTNVIGVNGNQAGYVDINGAAILGNDITITTNNVSNSGFVDFSSTINADAANSNRNLLIDSGNATTTVTGIVGGSEAINTFSISSADSVNINEINTQTGGIDINSASINLNGNLNTKDLDDAGQIRLVGAVNLNSDTNFDTDGVTSDANIFINGSVNNSTARNLVLNAGSADVTMTGNAGSGISLASLTATGNNIDLGQVTSAGNIDVTGSTSIDLYGDLTSNSGYIDLQNGNVTLNDNVTLAVSGANSVNIDGTINSDAAANDHTFTVNAATGSVNLGGDIGLSQAIQGLAVSTSGSVTVQNVDTRSGGVVVTSDTLNLNGSIDTTDDTSAAGIVTLTQDTFNLQASSSINTNSVSGTDNNISIVDTLPAATDANGYSLSLDAGTGTVSIDTQLTNLASFSVDSSLSTSLAGIETNNGIINVNSNTDIALAGSYNSGSSDMTFNADVDLNNSGLLNLTNTSTFDARNIGFSAATLTPDTASINATGTVSFTNTRTNIVLGEVYTSFQSYYLSNAFLDKITASTLQVRADNGYVMLNGANLIDNSYSLDLDARYIYSYLNDSSLNNLDATATNYIYLYKNITAENDIAFNAPIIYSSNSLSPGTQVTSTSGNIDISSNIAGSYAFNLNAVNGLVSLQGNTTVSLNNDFNVNTDSISHGNVSAVNNINFVNRSAYSQTGNLVSTNGNIAISSTNGNINLANNTISSGNISIDAGNGGITQTGSLESTNGDITISSTNGNIDL
ncbi:MAG: filamentous hemagglutinin N-terminal domain-containing protein, partial [Gammaproteobacteria bacterium]|nr:filamentous hemagglutinin N-terminal domain-containing protein [Gammaproteobacteria bacterium]